LYEKAVEDVTGGTIDLLGRSVESPQPGMQQEEFDRWVNNMPAEYIAAIGVPHGGTAEDLAASIRADEVRLIPIGRNRYALAPAYNPNQPIYDSETGKPFLFYYDKELHTNLKSAQLQHEDRRMMDQAAESLYAELAATPEDSRLAVYDAWEEDAETAEDLQMIDRVTDKLDRDEAKERLLKELRNTPRGNRLAVYDAWEEDAETADDLQMIDEATDQLDREEAKARLLKELKANPDNQLAVYDAWEEDAETADDLLMIDEVAEMLNK